MIKFDKFILDNGLKVIVNQDNTSPIVAVNLVYNVGARDESPDKTGFAHLFEHLMFGGSKNIPDYDEPLQLVGGENNAFTNNDYTDYYVTIPKENLETAFWLESDRMLSLAFSKKSLDVQRSVVIEEFRQRYYNQPYGDAWLYLRPLAYKVHPYQWNTIGKEISHIENATLKDVKDFFFKHYAPNNAILSVVGDVTTEQVKALAEKWFAPIERRDVPQRNLPQEPAQNEERKLTVEKDVPFDAIYKAYQMCDHLGADYRTTDLISDVLSNGKSTRFYQTLVQDKKLFTNIDAYISGSIDKGLFIISGKLVKGVKIEDAENAINEELNRLKTELVSDYELEKLKNKMEATLVFSEMKNMNVAMNLGYYELLGDANMINTEINEYLAVNAKRIQEVSQQLFVPTNCSTLYYLSNKKA